MRCNNLNHLKMYLRQDRELPKCSNKSKNGWPQFLTFQHKIILHNLGLRKYSCIRFSTPSVSRHPLVSPVSLSPYWSCIFVLSCFFPLFSVRLSSPPFNSFRNLKPLFYLPCRLLHRRHLSCRATKLSGHFYHSTNMLCVFFQVFEQTNFNKKHKSISFKPFNFAVILKLSKSQLLEKSFKVMSPFCLICLRALFSAIWTSRHCL